MAKSKENTQFGIWIPLEVWEDERLTALDKVILLEVDSLDSEETGCYASNEHIAKFCQCSVTKVSTSISKLIDCEYLSVASFDGRKRILKSNLSKSERQTFKNCKADFQKVKESNKYSNTLSNTESKKKESKKKEKPQTFDAIISDFVDKNNFENKEKIRELLGEWLKVRKMKRAATTDRALILNLEKLEGFAQESGISVERYLEEIICRGWQAFYPIRSSSVGTSGQDAPHKATSEEEEQKLKESYEKAGILYL